MMSQSMDLVSLSELTPGPSRAQSTAPRPEENCKLRANLSGNATPAPSECIRKNPHNRLQWEHMAGA